MNTKEAKRTLLHALQSASWLIEQDQDLKHSDTMDHIEHDLHAAQTALNFLIAEKEEAEEKTP